MRVPNKRSCRARDVSICRLVAQSLYTGVYARGGPSVELSSAVDLSHYLDRSEVCCH